MFISFFLLPLRPVNQKKYHGEKVCFHIPATRVGSGVRIDGSYSVGLGVPAHQGRVQSLWYHCRHDGQ